MQEAASQPKRAEQDDSSQVRKWRFAQLLRSGFDPDDAGLLADHIEIDLHEALRLVENGCPHKIALKILL